MPIYDVEIRASVRKIIAVHAVNEDVADELAHQIFSIMNTGDDEQYEQDTLSIEEKTDG